MRSCRVGHSKFLKVRNNKYSLKNIRVLNIGLSFFHFIFSFSLAFLFLSKLNQEA